MMKTEFQRMLESLADAWAQRGYGREYQHIDGREWEDFVGATRF